jgi:branched-chain amino acid transport system permease protein
VPMHLWPTAQPGEPTLGVMAVSSKIFGVELTQAHKLYAVFLPIAVGAALLCSNVRRSRLGRAMMAVRDSDLAAEALGVHPARTKVAAFGLSSFLAGVAGGMFALQQQYLTVSPPFDLQLSVQYITMIVLGGVGTTFGAVAGPLVFVFFTPLAEMVGRELPWISRLSSAQQSTVMFAVVVCGLLIVEPLGLYGVWLRVKRYFVGWPFRY